MSDPAVESAETTFNKSGPDPESLPPAPAARRWVALGSLTVVGLFACIVAVLLLPRARFALVDGPAQKLGAMASAQLSGSRPWVETSGTPAANALAFERMGRRGSFRLTQVKERPEVWLLLPVSEKGEEESLAYVPPSHFSGRLLRLEKTGRFLRPVRDLIEARGTTTVDSYLLIEGVSPRSHRPALIAFVLLALLGVGCLSFAVHLCLAVRTPRPTS